MAATTVPKNVKTYYTEFDNVMGDHIINLAMGTPSKVILKMAAEKFEIASKSKMVRN